MCQHLLFDTAAVLQMRLVGELFASGLGAAIVDTVFNPLEVLKVRVQLADAARRPSFPALASEVYALGGLPLLWLPGLGVTWARSFAVTGLRVGLYPTVRDACSGGSGNGIAQQAAAGMATGALSAGLATPLDLVRTRIHAQVGRPARRFCELPTVVGVVRTVTDESGVRAMWRGLGPTVARQALLSGGQLASYDTAKRMARARLPDGPLLHLACAAASGFVAQVCCVFSLRPRGRLSRLTRSPRRYAACLQMCSR